MSTTIPLFTRVLFEQSATGSPTNSALKVPELSESTSPGAGAVLPQGTIIKEINLVLGSSNQKQRFSS